MSTVYCLDRLAEPDEEFNEVAARLAPSFQGTLRYDHVDVRDTLDLERVIESIACKHSRLDGLIAAAGIQHITPALEYAPDEMMRMMDINYKGVFYAATACARQMIRYGCIGSIVLVASMSGFVANKGLITSVYNSSKAAVVQLSKNLAMEWGRAIKHKDGEIIGGVRVNALCPGHIITPMVEKNFEEAPGLKELWEKENMLGRLSSPAEYRGAALFLLSDASTFMTGASLVIDGGHTAW
jgi:NAD(P)-dependent dehydrogenase (short-subunit alcohol dehydrogenase family)